MGTYLKLQFDTVTYFKIYFLSTRVDHCLSVCISNNKKYNNLSRNLLNATAQKIFEVFHKLFLTKTKK